MPMGWQGVVAANLSAGVLIGVVGVGVLVHAIGRVVNASNDKLAPDGGEWSWR